MAKKRSIAKSVIFSILTCGLYLLYWMIKVNDELLDLNDEDGPSGFTVIILNLITCGIYGAYWAYKSGRRMTLIQERYGMRSNDNSILFTIISLFIGNLLVVAILQSDINEVLDFIELENPDYKYETNNRYESEDFEEDIIDEVDNSQLYGKSNGFSEEYRNNRNTDEELDEDEIDEIFENIIDEENEE